jgi:nucleotide-binding universal stress UspA family protein
MSKVLACIDKSTRATAVCDYAAWSAHRLLAALEFLHVLDRQPERASMADFSGAIGIDAQENLLEQLALLDEQRSKLAQEHGRQILQAAAERAESRGSIAATVLQRHGPLIETLLELEPVTRLIVMGQHHIPGPASKWSLDQNAERAVRSLSRPMLVVAGDFHPPERIVIAFDGSPTGRKMVGTVAASPLLKGLACHIIMVAEKSLAARDTLAWAAKQLADAGFSTTVTQRAGDADAVLRDYTSEVQADLLIMGAYGHSRIRHLIMGSTTSTLLRTSPVPILILR